MCVRELNDVDSYKRIPTNLTFSVPYLVKVTVQEALSFDYVNKELSDFLIQEYPRVPIFLSFT